MNSPLLFAEYLGNIRTLILTAQIGNPSDDPTSLAVHDGGRRLTLRHSGNDTELVLPAKVLPDIDLSLCLPASPLTSKTSRLQVQTPFAQTHAEGISIPCSAAELGITTSILCRGVKSTGSHCDATLLPDGKISDFRDLPSESWAEMMDLWHCHKPNEPEGDEISISSKGYGATSKLQARPGRAFVDKLSILVSEEDCTSTVVSQIKLISSARLCCKGQEEGGLR